MSFSLLTIVLLLSLNAEGWGENWWCAKVNGQSLPVLLVFVSHCGYVPLYPCVHNVNCLCCERDGLAGKEIQCEKRNVKRKESMVKRPLRRGATLEPTGRERSLFF